MKLYSNIITSSDVHQAFMDARTYDGADIYVEDMRTWKPRRHASGVEFWAYSHHGKRASGHGPIQSGSLDGRVRAASWTDYGYVIARLYNIDPDARIGNYSSRADFVDKVRRWVPRGESLKFLDVVDDLEARRRANDRELVRRNLAGDIQDSVPASARDASAPAGLRYARPGGSAIQAHRK